MQALQEPYACKESRAHAPVMQLNASRRRTNRVNEVKRRMAALADHNWGEPKTMHHRLTKIWQRSVQLDGTAMGKMLLDGNRQAAGDRGRDEPSES